MVGMADEGSADTFPYTIGGREMVFKSMTLSRITMLQRYVDAMQARIDSSQDPEEIIRLGKGISLTVWEMVESQFTTAEDLEFVQREIIAGRLEEEALTPLLSNGRTRNELPDDADPAPAKRAGRKAPAAKKAAPKKAANPNRAKR